MVVIFQDLTWSMMLGLCAKFAWNIDEGVGTAETQKTTGLLLHLSRARTPGRTHSDATPTPEITLPTHNPIAVCPYTDRSILYYCPSDNR